MLNRVSALWLVLGAIGGYAAAGPSVRAQPGVIAVPPTVNTGNTVTLIIDSNAYGDRSTSVPCTVAEIQGPWIRCKAADAFQDEREQRWYSLTHVFQITKHEK